MGLAQMKVGPKAAAKAAPKASPSEAALKEVISALADGDEAGAAKALGLAVQACMDEYETDETAEPDEE